MILALSALGVSGVSAAHAESAAGAASSVSESGSVDFESSSYQLSLNTGWLDLDLAGDGGGAAPMVPSWDSVGFESSFFLDVKARQVQMRLASFENELAIACDLRAKQLRLRLAGGDARGLHIRLDSDVALRGKPEIDARLVLALAGRQLTLDLPRVRVGAKWGKSGLQTEVLVPLIEGGF